VDFPPSTNLQGIEEFVLRARTGIKSWVREGPVVLMLPPEPHEVPTEARH
jgi:hypothetical protein